MTMVRWPRLCGSSDLFATDPGRGSTASVNYVACHDGFVTTADLTSTKKHNEANGEKQPRRNNDNHSVNFGHEGPSGDQIIVQQRQRATMNMLGAAAFAGHADAACRRRIRQLAERQQQRLMGQRHHLAGLGLAVAPNKRRN